MSPTIKIKKSQEKPLFHFFVKQSNAYNIVQKFRTINFGQTQYHLVPINTKKNFLKQTLQFCLFLYYLNVGGIPFFFYINKKFNLVFSGPFALKKRKIKAKKKD